MRKRFDLIVLPGDRATYARWRRGVIIVYCSIGLVVAAGLAAAHSSRLTDQLAGN
jgi:hypothetical protein